jgi:hypothetical protein
VKFEQMGEIAGRATAKEPDQLTSEERLAMAFMAGCEVEYAWTDNHQSVVRTKYPCGFQKIDGQWRVSEFRGATR